MRPIPLTVAIMAYIIFSSPISLSILCLSQQLRTGSVTNWTNSSALFSREPQASQHRNHKTETTTLHKIVLTLAATDRLEFHHYGSSSTPKTEKPEFHDLDFRLSGLLIHSSLPVVRWTVSRENEQIKGY